MCCQFHCALPIFIPSSIYSEILFILHLFYSLIAIHLSCQLCRCYYLYTYIRSDSSNTSPYQYDSNHNNLATFTATHNVKLSLAFWCGSACINADCNHENIIRIYKKVIITGFYHNYMILMKSCLASV